LILQEPDARKRASLLACAVTIGGRYFEKAFLWRFFREEVEMMKEATFIEEWLAEAQAQALEQGLQQGHETGRLEERRATVRHLLQWRFGRLPYGLEVRLERLTAEQLLPLIDRALDAASLQDFIAALD
jgi:predicted transposase YdaD